MKADKTVPNGYQKGDSLDFHQDKGKLLLSYVLRVAALAVFLPPFAAVAWAFHLKSAGRFFFSSTYHFPAFLPWRVFSSSFWMS